MEEKNQKLNPTPLLSSFDQTPTQTPPVPNTIHPPAGGSKSKFPILIIGIILFLLIAGSAAGFYAFKPHIEKLIPKPSTTQYQIATSSWKEYKNTSYGISLKYPNNLTKSDYSEDHQDNQILQLTEREPLAKSNPEAFLFKCGTRDDYRIFFSTSPKDETINEAINKIKIEESKTSVIISVHDLSVGKNQFKEISYSNGKYTDKCDGSIFYRKTYLYFLSDLKAVIYIDVTSRNKTPELLMQQIFSTVSFFPRDKHIPLAKPFYSYIPQEAFTSKDFIKREYNDKNLYDEEYNKTLNNFYDSIDKIPDNNLTAFKCTKDFSNTGSEFRYYLELKPNNTTIHVLPKAISDFFVGDPRYKVLNFRYCLTEDKHEFITTTNSSGGDVYEQLSDLLNYKLHTITTIHSTMSSCPNVLAITKDGKMYLGCGGGDITKYFTIKQVNIATGEIVDVHKDAINP